jgi:hypothetical protein
MFIKNEMNHSPFFFCDLVAWLACSALAWAARGYRATHFSVGLLPSLAAFVWAGLEP